MHRIAQHALDDWQERASLILEMSNRLMNLTAQQIRRSFEDSPASPLTAPLNSLAGTLHESGLQDVWQEVLQQLWANPLALLPHQLALTQDLMALWKHTLLRMMGLPDEAVVTPPKGDKRFNGQAWQDVLTFDIIKQSYLITSRHFVQAMGNLGGMSEESRRRILFYTRHFVDALSPSNFTLTNPEVLGQTSKTNGLNLLRGLNHLLQDLEKGDGQLRINMTDTSAFTLGKNIAATPGQVIFQNRMLQLIQYAPTTEQVLARPLLIVPPWINKYYILDLQEKTSFVRWARDQGHAVFIISWVNPDESMADISFDEYLKEGVLDAIKAVRHQTGAPQINAIGYCLGGTLLSMTLAWIAREHPTEEPPVASATFFTTLLDFTDPGDLGVYIDEERITSLERKMFRRGYLDGSEMATSFNMLRANDLIWSFVVNNYLLGKSPYPFDLLYWNADATRMPARMHSTYLRNMYLHNRLKDPDALVVAGRAINLHNIRVPSCFISTIEDHIAPWLSTYRGARLLGGPVKFILGGSGHIAGIINPPAAKKYSYWTQDVDTPLPDDPQQWQRKAREHAGSWWPAWHHWVSSRGDHKVNAWHPEKGPLKPLQPAPGSYVLQRCESSPISPRKVAYLAEMPTNGKGS